MICIAGKNNIAIDALDYLLRDMAVAKADLCVCLNAADKGEDQPNWQRSLRKYASDNAIRVCPLNALYEMDDLLFLSLEFDKIIRTERFRTGRLFNIHFSKLPMYKGMYTSALPLLRGEKETGVTLHRIDNGIDTGNIIAQETIRIAITDTARDVYAKYIERGFSLWKENIRALINGSFSEHPQPKEGASYFGKQSIDYKSIVIDLKKTAFEIHNQLRAYIFREYQLPEIQGYPIEKSVLLDERRAPEARVEVHEGYLDITGIDGYIVRATIAKEK